LRVLTGSESSRTRSSLRPLILFAALFLGVAVTLRLSGFESAQFIQPSFLWKSICKPLLRLSLFISMGLFIGQLIEAMGWTHRVGVMARPFMKWGHLTPQMAASFTSAFFSGAASLSMITTFYKEGTMDRRQLKLAVLLNTFPSYFLHLPTTFFILLPLVGRAGLIYLLITFGAAVVRLTVLLTYGHFCLPRYEYAYEEYKDETRSLKDVTKTTAKKFVTRLRRILLIVLPVYAAIAIVSKLGFFLWLRRWAAEILTTTLVPVEAMSVVIFSIVAEFTSGYAAAGAMLASGAMNVFQTVVALLAGNVIATPIRSLRHQMPYYMGIFDPGLGLRLMALTQAFRVASLLFAGSVYVSSAVLMT